MNEKKEQLKAAFSDEAFVKTCIEAESEEAVQKLFADKGIEMSLTEIELMAEMIGALADGSINEEQIGKLAQGGELSEDELSAVAGGDGPGDVIRKLSSFDDGISSHGSSIHSAVETVVKASGSNAGYIIGGIAAGLVVLGGSAYGICKLAGVDVEGGIKSGYNWAKEQIRRSW